MKIRILLTGLFLLLPVAFIGCSTNDAPTDTTGGEEVGVNEDLDLESSFGGYTMSDDQIAFGDEELMKEEDDGIEADDEIEEDPAVIDMGARPETDIYSVRLSWGMLEGDSTLSEPTDWSGSVSLLTDGAIVVERILRFEAGDYLVRPRPDRMTVELVSHTLPHWDGLLLTIFDPEGDVTTEDGAEKAGVLNELVIALGAFEARYLLTDLDSLEEILDVDDRGNQFSIEAFQVDEVFCPRGFLSGQWARTSADRGVLRGRWTSRFGLSHGWLKGHWGITEDGKRVFFAKYIGQHGEFRGLLRGMWDNAPDRPGGWFNGRWHNGNGIAGGLRGVWWDRPDRGHGPNSDRPADEFNLRRPHGFFHGGWRANCDDSVEDDSDDFPEDDEIPEEGTL